MALSVDFRMSALWSLSGSKQTFDGLRENDAIVPLPDLRGD